MDENAYESPKAEGGGRPDDSDAAYRPAQLMIWAIAILILGIAACGMFFSQPGMF